MGTVFDIPRLLFDVDDSGVTGLIRVIAIWSLGVINHNVARLPLTGNNTRDFTQL